MEKLLNSMAHSHIFIQQTGINYYPGSFVLLQKLQIQGSNTQKVENISNYISQLTQAENLLSKMQQCFFFSHSKLQSHLLRLQLH